MEKGGNEWHCTVSKEYRRSVRMVQKVAAKRHSVSGLTWRAGEFLVRTAYRRRGGTR